MRLEPIDYVTFTFFRLLSAIAHTTEDLTKSYSSGVACYFCLMLKSKLSFTILLFQINITIWELNSLFTRYSKYSHQNKIFPQNNSIYPWYYILHLPLHVLIKVF